MSDPGWEEVVKLWITPGSREGWIESSIQKFYLGFSMDQVQRSVPHIDAIHDWKMQPNRRNCFNEIRFGPPFSFNENAWRKSDVSSFGEHWKLSWKSYIWVRKRIVKTLLVLKL